MSSSSFALDPRNEDDIAREDFARIKDLNFEDNTAICQHVYSTLTTCLPSWISFQNLWSTLQTASDNKATIYDPCQAESLSSESQPLSPSAVELQTTAAILLEAPPSLEISSSATPHEVEIRENRVTLKKNYSVTSEQTNFKEEEGEGDKRSERAEQDFPSLSLAAAAAPAGPELEDSKSQQHDELIQNSSIPMHITEYTCLTQNEHRNEESPSKEKLTRGPRGKALLKAAVKGGKALRRVFRRHSSVQ